MREGERVREREGGREGGREREEAGMYPHPIVGAHGHVPPTPPTFVGKGGGERGREGVRARE
jgi:hypothetical protein